VSLRREEMREELVGYLREVVERAKKR